MTFLTPALDRLSRRRTPALVSLAMLVTGMAAMFTWNQLWHHQGGWAVGGDLWGILRGAHYIAWGLPAGVYSSDNGVVSFPGLELLLTPVAMLSSALHLSESFGPFMLPYPTSALLLMPVVLLLGATTLFAVDALAEWFELARGRRAALVMAVALVLWPVVTLWGHPEDCLAVTFGIYAFRAVLDGRWVRAGWLMGFGIAFQPLIALIVPVLLATTPQGQRIIFAVRSALLSTALLTICFLGNAADTFRAVVRQPTPPSINHATPWVSLAPQVAQPNTPAAHVAALVNAKLGRVALDTSIHVHSVPIVSGGPGRMIDVFFAVLVGVFVWRRPQTPVRLLWLVALVLASRCFFESVMTAYYTAPLLVLLFCSAALQSRRRFLASVVLGLEVTVFGYHHLSPWVWWPPIVVSVAAILAMSYPRARTVDDGDTAPSEEEDTQQPAPADVTLPGSLRRRETELAASSS